MSFFERSSFKLRCKTVIGIVLCYMVIKHVAFFTICAKLTMAFTFNSLPLNLYTFVSGCGCVSDLNKYIGGSTDLVEKRHGSADMHTPIPPPSTIIILVPSLLGSLCRGSGALCCGSQVYMGRWALSPLRHPPYLFKSTKMYRCQAEEAVWSVGVNTLRAVAGGTATLQLNWLEATLYSGPVITISLTQNLFESFVVSVLQMSKIDLDTKTLATGDRNWIKTLFFRLGKNNISLKAYA